MKIGDEEWFSIPPRHRGFTLTSHLILHVETHYPNVVLIATNILKVHSFVTTPMIVRCENR